MNDDDQSDGVPWLELLFPALGPLAVIAAIAWVFW